MKRIGLILGLVLIMNFSVLAQEEASSLRKTGWNVKIESVKSDFYGADLYLSSFIHYSDISGTPKDQIVNYGINYELIAVELPSTRETILGLSYQWPKWRFGIENGWNFKSSDLKTDKISSNTDTTISLIMFDHLIFPLTNEHNESLLSDVLFWIKNSIDIQTFKVYLDYKLSDITDVTFSIRGVSILSHHHIGQNQWALVEKFHISRRLDNKVTLDQNSKAKYWGIGPSMGLKFKTEHLNGSVELGVSRGKVDEHGLWKDKDDIRITDKTTGAVLSTVFLNGQFPLRQVRRVLIPNMEFQMKLTQRVNPGKDVYIDFYFGVLVATLWDALIAPKWSIPGNWTVKDGSGWKSQKEDLTLFGFIFGFEIGF